MGRPLIQPDRDSSPESLEVREPGTCIHCGLDMPPKADPALGPFCCGGCRAVYGMIHDSGLERFYDLKPSRIAPASDLRPDNLAWLDVMLESAPPAEGGLLRLSLDLQGVHCAACVWLLEELFRRCEGGRALTVNPARGTAEVVWGAGVDELKAYLGDAEQYGYRFGPPRREGKGASRGLQIRMGVSIAAAMNVMMYSLAYYFGLAPTDGPAYVLFGRLIAALATVTLLVGGWPFLSAAWHGLKRGLVHLDLPIALGMVLGYGGSLYAFLSVGPEAAYFDTITIFVALMLVGRWLQEHVLERNRNQLLASGGVADLYARRLENGLLHAVSAAELVGGDELWIAPGDLVPIAGVVMQRPATVSLDWITGESRPERREPGEKVPAGAFNAGREGFRLAAIESFSDSRLHDLMRAGPDETRPEARGWWQKVGTVYVIAVLGLASLGFLSWAGRDLHKAIEVTVAILVVTCPCAIGLALPLGRELVHVALRRNGVLLRRDDFLDRALEVRKIFFDKTGTLTRGQLQLTEKSRRELLRLPAEQRRILWNMAVRSNHPVSRAVSAALSLQPADAPERSSHMDPVLDAVSEEAGRGLSFTGEDGVWRLGRPSFAVGGGSTTASQAGATLFSLDGAVLAAVHIEEDLKKDAVDEVEKLGANGFEVHLLSGDDPQRVDEAARRLGLDPSRVRGALSPEDKAEIVTGLDEYDTLMVGDGINDSPSFDAAYAAATPAVDRALMPQKSDFYFLGDGVAAVRRTLSAARYLRRVQNANLFFAAAYNALAVGLCLSGHVTPVVAAVLMPLSSVTVVTITSLRLRTDRSRRWMS